MFSPENKSASKKRARLHDAQAPELGLLKGRQLRVIPHRRLNEGATGTDLCKAHEKMSDQEGIDSLSAKLGKDVKVEQVNVMLRKRKVVRLDRTSLKSPAESSKLPIALGEP